MRNKSLFFVLWFILLFLSRCQPIPKNMDIADKTIRIHMMYDPPSLDPRIEKSIAAKTILHAIYEGLMRNNMHGEAIPALAERIVISEDQKTYTFTLRKSFWSNGDLLTSEDFARTWKTILSPDFATPNADHFYVIKGAKEAKEGKIDPKAIGVSTPNSSTLIIELNSPTPSFLELLTTHFFYPVHSQASSENIIANGPFKMDSWKKKGELSLVKNSEYWDAREVKTLKLLFISVDEHTALRMFQDGEIEWVGSPMGVIPQDSIATLKHRQQLRITPAAGVHWLRLNTNNPPLELPEMRKALAYAINRKAIVEQILGQQKPATAIVPLSFNLPSHSFFQDNDTPAAWFLFQKALEKMNISKDNMDSISLCYLNSNRNQMIAHAIQTQWNKTFDMEINIESCEPLVFFDRLKQQDYQVALGYWFADYQDPINFLNLFKAKNSNSQGQWDIAAFTELLNQSSVEVMPFKRKEILGKAEAILMQEMPVIPLFSDSFNYAKSDELLGVYFSSLGYLDFKFAFYED